MKWKMQQGWPPEVRIESPENMTSARGLDIKIIA
jgi:hypothetical protein